MMLLLLLLLLLLLVLIPLFLPQELMLRVSCRLKACVAGSAQLVAMPIDLALGPEKIKKLVVADELTKEWQQVHAGNPCEPHLVAVLPSLFFAAHDTTVILERMMVVSCVLQGEALVMLCPQARDTLSRICDFQSSCSAAILEVAQSKLAMFLSIDRSWGVEIALYQAMLGKQGERVLEKEVETKLPTKVKLLSLAESIAQLAQLRCSPICRVAGTKGSDQVGGVISMLQNMLQGTSPDTELMTSPMMKKVALTLPFFATHPQTAESGAEPIILVGKDAIAARLAVLTADEPSQSLDSLDWFMGFKFLLTPEQETAIKAMTRKLVGHIMKSKRLSTKTTTTSKGVPSTTSSASAKDDVLAETMALFG
jgi:hypothetical protein